MSLLKRLSLGVMLASSLVGCAGVDLIGAMNSAMDHGGTYHSTVNYPGGGSTTYTTTISGNHATTTAKDYKR